MLCCNHQNRMGGLTMNENIDLTQILEGCPKGTKFYSSAFGEVVFQGIFKKHAFPIYIKLVNEEDFWY